MNSITPYRPVESVPEQDPLGNDDEISVLGAIMGDPSCADSAMAIIQEEDLGHHVHRQIWKAIQAVLAAGGEPDYLAVRAELTRLGQQPPGSTWTIYINAIADLICTSANLKYHAQRVRDVGIRRRAIAALKSGQDPAAVGSGLLADSSRSEGPRFVDDVEIETRPEPTWRVENVLQDQGLIVVYGAPGCGKGFVVIDLAFSIATDTPWAGREVVRGPAAYLAAEAGGGLGKRVLAWKTGAEWYGRAGVYFAAEGISLMDPRAVSGFIARLRALPELPVLVIIDTVARTMIGGDENSTKDMSIYIASVDRIRAEVGAAVVLVHHTKKGSEQERGNTALRGAADTMIAVQKEGALVRLECTKQRDADEFAPIDFRLVSQGNSAAVITATEAWQQAPREMTPNERIALLSLSRDFLDDGATASAWWKASGVAERSFYRTRTALVRRGYVEAEGRGRGARYTVTDAGKEETLPPAT